METISEKWFDLIINEFDIRDSKEKCCDQYINESLYFRIKYLFFINNKKFQTEYKLII